MYAAVLRGGEPIAECGSDKRARNFARAIAATTKQTKFTYNSENMAGHGSRAPNGDAVVVVCGQDKPRRKAFELVSRIENRVESPHEALAAVDQFNWDDPITSAQADIDQVKTIMIENVDKLLERGEHLSLLVDRTQELSTGAHSFRKQAQNARSRLWWKNMRMVALLLLFVALFVVLVHFFF